MGGGEEEKGEEKENLDEEVNDGEIAGECARLVLDPTSVRFAMGARKTRLFTLMTYSQTFRSRMLQRTRENSATNVDVHIMRVSAFLVNRMKLVHVRPK